MNCSECGIDTQNCVCGTDDGLDEDKYPVLPILSLGLSADKPAFSGRLYATKGLSSGSLKASGDKEST